MNSVYIIAITGGRRLTRDVVERSRTRESVTLQFLETVQPIATLYVRPTSIYADLVLSGEQAISKSVATVLKHVLQNSSQGDCVLPV
jgi:uridine kinase